MKRISTLDRWLNKFGLGKDGFQDEHEVTGVGGTFVDASIMDHLQEEVANVVESAGLALDAAQYNQLHQAIVQRDRRASDILCASTWRRELSGLPAATDVLGLTHDGARRWLLVGEAGLIATSDDLGETWAVRTPGAAFSGRFNAAHYAAGLFVIVGQSGEVQTSPDGVTWTSRNTAVGPELFGVTYDGTAWVAVGQSSGAGYVITATVATSTWTAQTPPASSVKLFAVASDGAGKTVAVGDRLTVTTGLVAVSTDHGVTWTSELAPSLVSDLTCVTRSADGTFYAAAVSGDIISSANPAGATSSSDWTTVRQATGEPSCRGIAAPGDGMVVCARGGTSSDPVDPVVGHAGGEFRAIVAPTPEGGHCAHYAQGVVLMGLDGGGVLRSLTMGHRLAVL